MTSGLSRSVGLTLCWLTLASCRDTTTETETAEVPLPARPELAVGSNTWVTRADMPTERWNVTTAVVPNAAGQSILYAIGGTSIVSGGSLSKVQAYNVATNTWIARAPLPVPLYATNGAQVIRAKVYVSGGVTSYKGYQASLYIYDPATNSWTRKHDMPNTTYAGVSGVINDKLYVLTGCDQEDCYPSQADAFFYRYDPAANQWTVFPTPPSLHSGGVGAAIGGKFYVAGNAYGGRQLDVYDPATNRWTTKASAPVDREAPEWHSAASSTC